MTGLAISAAALARRFGDNDAVRGVDLAIPEGEIYGFLGPNGAGKTTTVRMLCTLLLPTAGQAAVAGSDIVDAAHDVRLKIGVALQEAALDDKQTGREILDVQGRLYGLRGALLRERIEATCSLIDLGDAIDHRVATYSGGMKRRLDLATALVHQPQVLFLDEPTTGLDPISRARVWEEIERLNRDLGVTIFLTTQYLEEADALAHRVGIINDGLLVTEGTPGALKREIGADVVVAVVPDLEPADAERLRELPGVTSVLHDGHEITLVTADGPALVGGLALRLAELGTPPETLTVRTPSLDDVFLRATGHRIDPVEADEVHP